MYLQSGNFSDSLVPVVDKFLPQNDQYLPLSPIQALKSGNFHQIPVITGLTSLEAANSKGAVKYCNGHFYSECVK